MKHIARGSIVRIPDRRGIVVTYVVAAVRHSPIDFAELRPIGGGVPIAVPFSDLDRRPDTYDSSVVPVAELVDTRSSAPIASATPALPA